LDLAVDLFVARILQTVGLAFLMWLPVRCGLLLIDSGALADSGLQWLFALFTSSLVQALSIALVIQVVYAELQGRPQSIARALKVALLRAPALLLSTAVISTGTTLGMLCCVPGIYLSYLWSAAPSALVLEGLGPIESLRRSQALVRKQFPRWIGLTVCALLIKLPYDAAAVWLEVPESVEWITQELGLSLAVFGLLKVFITSLLLAVSTALWAIVATVFYLDCRVRTEGFDLSMRLERLQSTHAPRQAAQPL
jgi:hypothetical protein